jgi:hypothetical protein
MPRWRFYKALGPRGQGHPPMESQAGIPGWDHKHHEEKKILKYSTIYGIYMGFIWDITLW